MKSAFYTQIANSNAHRASRDANCDAALENKTSFDELVAISFDLNDKIHFKACWALELVLEKNLSFIIPYLNEFCAKLPHYTHDSAIRSISKICQFLAQSTTISLTEMQEQQLIETCLDWLIRDEKVAAKAYAMRALYALGKKHQWINDELKTILSQDYSNHSPAYQAAAKDILKRLK